jgi:hypothetical protein
MSTPKNSQKSFADREKRHQTVTDSFDDGLGTELLTVRLGEFWSDLIRVADQRRDPESPRPSAAVPLLDEMKGIARWD